MPGLRLLRRAAVPAVMVFGALYIGGISFVRDAYPADPFKSDALAKCIASDPGFVRFLPEERTRCYARQPRITRDYSPGTPRAEEPPTN